MTDSPIMPPTENVSKQNGSTFALWSVVLCVSLALFLSMANSWLVQVYAKQQVKEAIREALIELNIAKHPGSEFTKQ